MTQGEALKRIRDLLGPDAQVVYKSDRQPSYRCQFYLRGPDDLAARSVTSGRTWEEALQRALFWVVRERVWRARLSARLAKRPQPARWPCLDDYE